MKILFKLLRGSSDIEFLALDNIDFISKTDCLKYSINEKKKSIGQLKYDFKYKKFCHFLFLSFRM